MPKRLFSLLLLLAALVLLAIPAGCGGKKRSPPLAGPPSGPGPAGRDTASDPGPEALPAVGKIPRIRVLLRSGFGSVEVAGSALGPNTRISSSEGRIHLWNGRGTRLGAGSGFRLEPGPGASLRVEGKVYRGILEAFINPLGDPVLVNDLSLEDYLKGVVPNELNPGGFPQQEALKALTVSARTYALASLGQYATRGFDLFSDQRSQVYQGAGSEREDSNRIVDSTRGMVATFHDRPIVAFYSSTCGGVTEDYQAVFQRDAIPYLRGGASCPDGSSPYSSWKETIRAREVQSRLDRTVGVGRLRQLIPLKKSRWGRTVEMRFVGSKGEKVLTGLALRRALGLRSNWITDIEARRDDSGYIVQVEVEGRGWGHGVGLCQLGAVELAKRGWESDRILKHYYHGIQVVQLW